MGSGYTMKHILSKQKRKLFKPGFFFTGVWTSPTNGFGGFLSLEKKSLSLGGKSLSLGRKSLSLSGKILCCIGKLLIFAIKLYKNCRSLEVRFRICLSLEKKNLEFRKNLEFSSP